jgi:hypothetical protein
VSFTARRVLQGHADNCYDLRRRVDKTERTMIAITLVMVLLFAVLFIMEDIRIAAGADVLLGVVLWLLGRTAFWYGTVAFISVYALASWLVKSRT